MFVEGVTFFIHKDPHLWVIISDPAQNPDDVVYVNFTTLYPNLPVNDPRNDRSCVLDVGDHSFIKHTTIVYYGGVNITSVDHLTHRYQSNGLTLDTPIKPELLSKIRRGASVSDHITPFAIELLEQQRLI